MQPNDLPQEGDLLLCLALGDRAAKYFPKQAGVGPQQAMYAADVAGMTPGVQAMRAVAARPGASSGTRNLATAVSALRDFHVGSSARQAVSPKYRWTSDTLSSLPATMVDPTGLANAAGSAVNLLAGFKEQPGDREQAADMAIPSEKPVAPSDTRLSLLQALAASRVVDADSQLAAHHRNMRKYPLNYALNPFVRDTGPINHLGSLLSRRVNAVRANPDDRFRFYAYVPGADIVKGLVHGGGKAQSLARGRLQHLIAGNGEATKQSGFLSDAQGSLNQAGDWLNQNALQPAVGAFNKHVTDPVTNHAKANLGIPEGGFQGFMDRNPWAIAPIIGGGIGAGVGLLGSGGKKKKDTLGSVLQSAMLGAGAGGLAWGAREMFNGPAAKTDNTPESQAAAPRGEAQTYTTGGPGGYVKVPDVLPNQKDIAEGKTNLGIAATNSGRDTARIFQAHKPTFNAAGHLLWANDPGFGEQLGGTPGRPLLDNVRSKFDEARVKMIGPGSGAAAKDLNSAALQAYESLAQSPERPLFRDPAKATAASSILGLPATLGKSESWNALENAPTGGVDSQIEKLRAAKDYLDQDSGDISKEPSILTSPAARTFYEGTLLGIGGRQIASKGLRTMFDGDTTQRDAASLSRMLAAGKPMTGSPPAVTPPPQPGFFRRSLNKLQYGAQGTLGSLLSQTDPQLQTPAQAADRSSLIDRMTTAANARGSTFPKADRAAVSDALSGKDISGLERDQLRALADTVAKGNSGVSQLASSDSMVQKLKMYMSNNGHLFPVGSNPDEVVRNMLTGKEKPSPTMLKALEQAAPGHTYSKPGLFGRWTGSSGAFAQPQSIPMMAPKTNTFSKLVGATYRGTPYGALAALVRHAGPNPSAKTMVESQLGLGPEGFNLADPEARRSILERFATPPQAAAPISAAAIEELARRKTQLPGQVNAPPR